MGRAKPDLPRFPAIFSRSTSTGLFGAGRRLSGCGQRWHEY